MVGLGWDGRLPVPVCDACVRDRLLTKLTSTVNWSMAAMKSAKTSGQSTREKLRKVERVRGGHRGRGRVGSNPNPDPNLRKVDRVRGGHRGRVRGRV